jgi:DNA-directed RNA polymerase
MATSLQISRQFSRELQAHQEGIRRLKEATAKAEARVYASSSIYGNKLVDQGLGATIAAIEEKRSRIAAGSTGEFAAHVQLMDGIPSSTLALIVLKTTIDVVFEKRQAKHGASYGDVVRQIGGRVYDECLLSQFAAAEPEAFHKTQIHQAKGYSYRVAKYRATMRRVSHEALKWPTGHKVKVGAWLLDRLCEATGWFHSSRTVTSRKRQLTLLHPAPEVIRSVDAMLAAAEAVSACRWPMLCEPNDWQPDLTAPAGGYLTQELRSGVGSRLIRGLSHRKASQSFPRIEGRGETAAPWSPGDGEENPSNRPAIACPLPPLAQASSSDPEHARCRPNPGVPDLTVPVRFLNAIQKVPFQVNQGVLEVALRCQEARVSIGSFRQSDPLPLPEKPDWDTATDEEKLKYRRARVEVEEDNALLAQRNYQTAETLFIAQMYRDEESFWFPWSFDFRARVYPLSNHLTPQGTDFARSLLVSAYSGPADQEWLAFQVATTWGLGKETLEERQEWVRASQGVIQAVATDPMGTISTWQGADEPWQFLAACLEYHACFIAYTRSWSNLLVGFDATCSGLQHLAALTRDRGAAELVNVAPTERPADAYKTVAEAAKKYLPEEFRDLITRKVTKRVVMCLPYGLTRESAKDYLRQALPKGHGIPMKDLVDAVYVKAIPEVLPGPMRARKWIQDSVNLVANQTGRPVAFTSPSGFPVILEKRVYPTEQVDTRLLGRRIRVTVSDFDADSAPLDGRKITIGSVPNLIHSFDAALLHLAFSDWDRPIALVHDCISTLSCDVGWTMEHIRETFATMYETDQLAQWADQLGVPVDPEVMINTLDPAEIRESNYLFC